MTHGLLPPLGRRPPTEIPQVFRFCPSVARRQVPCVLPDGPDTKMIMDVKLPPPRTAQLGYVSAAEIEGPHGSLSGTVLRGRGGDAIGIFDGVLVEPSERIVAYLVVQTFHG